MIKISLDNSFKEHRIFDYFWSNSILECLVDNIELEVNPTLDMNYYQKVFEMPLHNLGKHDELYHMSAKVKLTLTSVKDKIFNIEEAITGIDSDGAKSAILVNVDITDDNRQIVFSTQFNLGSKEGEKIKADSKYLKRFLFLY